MGDKVLPHFQPNDVEAIHIQGAGELNLVHKNNLWSVQERGNYPANFHLISDLLIKLKSLKVVEADTVESSQLGRVNLDAPGKSDTSGTLVEFKDAEGKAVASLLLGKKHLRESSPSPFGGGTADGRYILLPNEPTEVLLISDPLASLQPNPQPWLSKDFFKVEKIKSISVTATNAEKSWKVARESESAPWTLLNAQPGDVLDTNKIAMTANAMSDPSFADVIPNAETSNFGLYHPTLVTLETFDHFTYTLKIAANGPKQTYYVTVNVTAEIGQESPENLKKLQEKLKQEQTLSPWVYLVGSWIMDPLIRERAQIMEGAMDKPPDVTEPAPKPIEPSSVPPVIK
jgi:hypothetical protein